MSREEMKKLGWDRIDILLITGDAYIDHPSFGAALIGRLLIAEGYRVGIIAQPEWQNPESVKVLGVPALACAVTSGNLDSMVNIYTAGRRFRRDDAYSPGGKTGKRPPHALTVYSQLLKRAFPGMPVVLGGIEASLRRVAHYDYWQDKIKPGVLVDSKADILVYGMGERATLEIFLRISRKTSLRGIKGTAVLLGKNAAFDFMDKEASEYIQLPSYDEHLKNRDAVMLSTLTVEREMNPYSGKGLYQLCGERLLLVESPAPPLSPDEMDKVYSMPFSRMPHPSYREAIPAFETVKDSVCAVRGCPGGCSFCGLVSHQGHFISSRSHQSIIDEIKRLVKMKVFRGTVSDIGGAAGNIYGHGSFDKEKCRKCRRSSCLFPEKCPNYNAEENSLLQLLDKIGKIEGVKHLFINSGLRLDLALLQKKQTRELIKKHISGHLKVAPEHLHPEVLKLMRKNKADDFYEFLDFFYEESRRAGKEQYLVPLFISNFPGSSEKEMKVVDDFLNSRNWSPQQVQDYIPLPMTMGAAMYYSGKSPDGKTISVNRGLKERRPQINMLKKKRKRSFSR